MSASIMSIAEVGEGAADLDALAAAAQTPTGGIQPPPGLPDVAALAKLANELFATLPGQSLPTPAGPSLAGFGASPADVASPSQRYATAEATPSLPTSDVPSAFGTPVTPPPLDRSVIDQQAFDRLFGGFPSFDATERAGWAIAFGLRLVTGAIWRPVAFACIRGLIEHHGPDVGHASSRTGTFGN